MDNLAPLDPLPCSERDLGWVYLLVEQIDGRDTNLRKLPDEKMNRPVREAYDAWEKCLIELGSRRGEEQSNWWHDSLGGDERYSRPWDILRRAFDWVSA